MGQYTCDECSEIPKIISTNLEKRTIIIKCKNHGLKELSIREYIINSLKYNTTNWKCSDSEHIQKTSKEIFKLCQCGKVYCSQCYPIHKVKYNHNNAIESDKFYLQCKNSSHFGTKYSGYCHECDENFCEICEKDHKGHAKIHNSNMEVEQKEIEKIRKLNREYRSLITYYESLIRLNNLILYSYEKNRGNYYNLYNLNRIISNIKRKNIIDTFKNTSENDYDNNAFINALVASGLDTKHFYFYGFLPAKESEAKEEILSLKDRRETLIFYEAPHRIIKTLNLLRDGLGNRNACLSRELTKLNEEYIRGELDELVQLDESTIKGEIVLIIEGNKEENTVDDSKIIARVAYFVDLGLSQKDAINVVSEEFGVNKNYVKKLVF